MTLYLEWEANQRHAEAQRIASERHRYAGGVHNTSGLMAALKKIFGAKATATIAVEKYAEADVANAVAPLNKKHDAKHRKAS